MLNCLEWGHPIESETDLWLVIDSANKTDPCRTEIFKEESSTNFKEYFTFAI